MGISPCLFLSYQKPEKTGSSKYVKNSSSKRHSGTMALRGLAYPKFTHQCLACWRANPLVSCLLLLLWHGYWQVYIESSRPDRTEQSNFVQKKGGLLSVFRVNKWPLEFFPFLFSSLIYTSIKDKLGRIEMSLKSSIIQTMTKKNSTSFPQWASTQLLLASPQI